MLRNCKECYAVFSHSTNTLCPNCRKQMQEDLQKVKSFLQENKRATIIQVADATEVSSERIEEFIRDGRLVTMPSGVSRACDICGDEVKIGRICPKCRGQLAGSPKETKPAQLPRAGGRVHVLKEIQERSKD